MKIIKDKILSKYFSELAKKTHKKNPRSKEFYAEMGRKSGKARRKNLQTHRKYDTL